MADVIGIRVADGSMRTLFDTEYRGRKNMIITTVNDQQDSVSVALFRDEDESFANPVQLCELDLENLLPLPQGEVEIALNTGIDDDGNLYLIAEDDMGGERNSISINIVDRPTTNADGNATMSDEGFDVSTDSASLSGATLDTSSDMGLDPQVSFDDPSKPMDEEALRRMRRRNRRRFVALLIFLIVSISGLAVGVYFIYNILQDSAVPSLEAGLPRFFV